jgi:hypothetical protein
MYISKSSHVLAIIIENVVESLKRIILYWLLYTKRALCVQKLSSI